MDFTQIQGVLFDLDGTLYRQDLMRALMAVELAGLALSGPRQASRHLRALKAYRAAQEQLRHSEPGPAPSQAEAAARASGLTVAEVETLVAEWMIRRPLKYLQFCRRSGVSDLLDRLRRADIRAGILSDYPAGEKLRALGLEGRFAPVLCATDREIGAFKPSPRGFLRACEVWRLAPSEVLYVGDRIEVDAAGAEAAGMRCVIIGAERDRSGSAGGFAVYPSFERLSRAFDHR
jgi:HAD superfamily hydrolase (TIGR01549 family)